MQHIQLHLQLSGSASKALDAQARGSSLLDGRRTEKESRKEKQLRRGRGMRGLKRVISYGPCSGQACVDDGGPALQAMMMITVKQVGDADRYSRRAGFDGSESGTIVDEIIGQESFVTAATAKVQRGKVIEGSRSADGCDEKVIFTVPEAMLRNWRSSVDRNLAGAVQSFRRIEGRLFGKQEK